MRASNLAVLTVLVLSGIGPLTGAEFTDPPAAPTVSPSKFVPCLGPVAFSSESSEASFLDPDNELVECVLDIVGPVVEKVLECLAPIISHEQQSQPQSAPQESQSSNNSVLEPAGIARPVTPCDIPLPCVDTDCPNPCEFSALNDCDLPDAGLCEKPELGVYVNSARACVGRDFGICDIPSLGLWYESIRICVEPQLCSYPEVGIEPTCIRPDIRLCDDGVGVEVNGKKYCVDVEPCALPEIGLKPQCYRIDPCAPSEGLGVKVNGNPITCVDAALCSNSEGYGVKVRDSPATCVKVDDCNDPDEVGASVNGYRVCRPKPDTCQRPGYGVEPVCVEVEGCGSGEYGAEVKGVDGCVRPPVPCTPPDIGVRPNCKAPCTLPEVGIEPTCLENDLDKDGYTDADENAAGSRPDSAQSRPDTDDDGDGTLNRNEPAAPTRSACTGAYGVVAGPDCKGYAGPPGATTDAAYVDAAGGAWVWDATCSYGVQANYASCKGFSSNYAGSSSLYTGRFAPDGYGWRRVTDSGACASMVQVVAGPYTYVAPSTGDGVTYRLGAVICAFGTTYNLVRQGTIDAGVLPVTIPAPVPGGIPYFGPDGDGDGLPEGLYIPMETVTIQDTFPATTSNAPRAPFRIPVDNDDRQPFP